MGCHRACLITRFVYIFDASTGALVARVGPFGNVINHLAFSPDGRWLAANSHADVGLKVIDAQTWRIVAEDKNYAGDSYGAAFAAGRPPLHGRLMMVSSGSTGLGRISKSGGRSQQRAATSRYSVAVDPTGELLAVGFYDTQGVDFYDASTLQFRFCG